MCAFHIRQTISPHHFVVFSQMTMQHHWTLTFSVNATTQRVSVCNATQAVKTIHQSGRYPVVITATMDGKCDRGSWEQCAPLQHRLLSVLEAQLGARTLSPPNEVKIHSGRGWSCKFPLTTGGGGKYDLWKSCTADKTYLQRQSSCFTGYIFRCGKDTWKTVAVQGQTKPSRLKYQAG